MKKVTTTKRTKKVSHGVNAEGKPVKRTLRTTKKSVKRIPS